MLTQDIVDQFNTIANIMITDMHETNSEYSIIVDNTSKNNIKWSSNIPDSLVKEEAIHLQIKDWTYEQVEIFDSYLTLSVGFGEEQYDASIPFNSIIVIFNKKQKIVLPQITNLEPEIKRNYSLKELIDNKDAAKELKDRIKKKDK